MHACICVLDPINFTQHGGDHHRPQLEGMTAQQREDIMATVMRLNGYATTAAAVNAELANALERAPATFQRGHFNV